LHQDHIFLIAGRLAYGLRVECINDILITLSEKKE